MLVRIRITFAVVLTTVIVLALAALSFPTRSTAVTVSHPLVVLPDPTAAAVRALQVQQFVLVLRWNNTVLWNKTAEVNRRAEAAAAARRQVQARPVRLVSSSVVSSPEVNGHNPCAEPISGVLPSYIVQRESGGQCGVINYNGCGGRTCLGWAQVDMGHFWKVSPWGGRGTCYGLSYNACVSTLVARGGLGPWGG